MRFGIHPHQLTSDFLGIKPITFHELQEYHKLSMVVLIYAQLMINRPNTVYSQGNLKKTLKEKHKRKGFACPSFLYALHLYV